jgi:oligoendopeptidase F
MANSNTKILKRSEISEEDKWKLEHIYENNELWEEDFEKLKSLAAELLEFPDTIGSSSQALLNCLNLNSQIERLFEKVYVYANMRSHEDTTNSYYQGLADRTESLRTEISSVSSFITPELLEIPDDNLKAFFEENEALRHYEKYIGEIIRNKPHILSAKEEQILAMAGELSQAPSTIFSMINNADIKFPKVKDEKGNEIELTKGRYISLMESYDREVRKNAFEALYSTYKKQINTFAATLSSNVKGNIFNSTVRKFPSAREASLFSDNVSLEVYDNLIEVIHKNIHLMHRYVSLRKKMLGLEEIHMYDLYTPIVKDVKMEAPYEEAVETVKKALEVLGSKYSDDLSKGFTGGWIDKYENEGKRSGAYSWGCYDSHPYVLLNYNDTVDNMFTLAHEMGHAMHSFYSDNNQPYIYAGYKIFVAEVASTFNESILMNHLILNTEDKMKKLYLLNHYLESFRGTVYRQTMFAEFEKIIHEKAETGEALTAEVLSSIYHDLNKYYYGEEIIVDDYIDIEWARIPHFYSSFYVYKYATGFSAATALSSKVLKEGDTALEKYLNFLKSGGSDYPLELLKKAGVDMTSPEPIQAALKVFENTLNEFENLLNVNKM